MKQTYRLQGLKRLAYAAPLSVIVTMLATTGSLWANEAKNAPKPDISDGAVSETSEQPATQKSSEGASTATNDETRLVPDYRDDRSTPQALIESYYNAINRKEYTRAYSYYSDEGRETYFDIFTKGYEHTKSVTIKLGHTEPDPGAGQIYWSLPLAIQSETDDGETQVYTGCYTIRMTNPAMQEVPPFMPMSIMTGSLTQSPLELDKSVPENCDAP